MTYDEIISKVAIDIGLPIGIVDKTYKATWKVIRDHICSLPLKEELSDEDFQKLHPNINIPSIGKLYVTLDRYKRIKKFYNIRKEQLNQIKNATHNKD